MAECLDGFFVCIFWGNASTKSRKQLAVPADAEGFSGGARDDMMDLMRELLGPE